MKIFDQIFDYAVNPKIKLSNRTALVIITLAVMFGIDSWLKASYRIRTMNRITVLKEANALLKDSTSDSLTRNYAYELRKSILIKKVPPKFLTLDYKPVAAAGRNKTAFIISCIWLYVLTLVIAIIGVAVSKKGNNGPTKVIANILLLTFWFLVAGYFLAFCWQFAPPILGNWKFNYVLIAFCQLIMMRFIVNRLTFEPKPKTSAN